MYTAAPRQCILNKIVILKERHDWILVINFFPGQKIHRQMDFLFPHYFFKAPLFNNQAI